MRAVVAALTIVTACSGESGSESNDAEAPSIVGADADAATTTTASRNDDEQAATTSADDSPTPDATATATATATGEAYETARQVLVESGRVDLDSTGNRVALGPGALLGTEPLEVRLGDTARWIVPAGPSSWIAVLDDGSTAVIELRDDGEATVAVSDDEMTDDALSKPPLATSNEVTSFDEFHEFFDDPLPDTRVVTTDDALVALGGPTDRYPHGVLGDALEASTIELADPSGTSATLVELDAPDVFEAVSPMIADVDDDGNDDVIATVSNADTGARIVAYSLADGSIVAQTDAIGQGNRWRNQLAVAPVGPGGEIELIDVQTPHIGGILQFFRADGDRLELAASAQTYSTHSIGSRNLDLGIVSDADGDGQLDVIVPTQNRGELAVVTRDDAGDNGTREIGRVDLGGVLSTNVAAADSTDRVSYAVGLQSGVVLVWR